MPNTKPRKGSSLDLLPPGGRYGMPHETLDGVIPWERMVEEAEATGGVTFRVRIGLHTTRKKFLAMCSAGFTKFHDLVIGYDRQRRTARARELRRAGWKQDAIADEMDVSQGKVSKMVRAYTLTAEQRARMPVPKARRRRRK